MRRRRRIAWLLPLIMLHLPSGPAAAAGTTVQYNKEYVEDALRAPDFSIEDKMAVLSLVLSGLPERVKVYPTENYFYFSFYYKGIKYSGNLRFDIADRDKGVVHFNYFKDFTLWQRDEAGYSAELGKADGVMLTKVTELAYDLTFKSKTVRFELNDLSKVKPPEGVVLAGETYIGPVFDESAIRFFLVFNESQKTFHYILDESQPVADQFDMSDVSDRITIGIRTGFAFYDDRFAHRKILIGVHGLNTSVNNYLDGPFDQLPDNFLVGDVLKKAILAASPDREGQIDRFGNSPDGETRYLIAPYMTYEEQTELAIVADCAATEKLPVYYSCFSFAEAAGDDDQVADPKAADPNADSADKPADGVEGGAVKDDPAAKPAK